MTNELEKQFFDTFGIEPREFKYNIGIWNNELNCDEEHIVTIPYIHYKNYSHCPSRDKGFIYPQITDRILLELICIIHQASLELYGEEYYFESVNYKELKEEVIAKCKRLADKNAFSEVTGEHIKHQVRTLFEEG